MPRLWSPDRMWTCPYVCETCGMYLMARQTVMSLGAGSPLRLHRRDERYCGPLRVREGP